MLARVPVAFLQASSRWSRHACFDSCRAQSAVLRAAFLSSASTSACVDQPDDTAALTTRSRGDSEAHQDRRGRQACWRQAGETAQPHPRSTPLREARGGTRYDVGAASVGGLQAPMMDPSGLLGRPRIVEIAVGRRRSLARVTARARDGEYNARVVGRVRLAQCSRRLTVILILVAVFAAGCGAGPAKPLPFSRWFSYDVRRKAVRLKMIPAYNGVLAGANFNGYGHGQIDVVVPVRWTVTVDCANTGLDGRHSCAIVESPGGTSPVLSGASSPTLAGGQSSMFSFRASRRGVYRISSLVPTDLERGGMWDVLEIAHVRLPHVLLLRRSP
jgi:hypothetical protein